MFLSGSFLGGDFLSSPLQILPTSSFNRVRVSGDLQIGNLRILNKNLTDEERNAIVPLDAYVWTPETILLVPFENNTNFGNTDLSESLAGFTVLRTKNDENLAKEILIGNDPLQEEYIDFSPARSNSYKYSIFPRTATEIAAPLETNSVDHDYFGWFLVLEYNNYAYKFDLNLTSNPINRVTDTKIYDTKYTQFPSISHSDKNYLSGSISCWMGFMENGQYVDTIEYLEQFEKDITDGQPKLLKNRKGEIWQVYTHDFVRSYEDNISDQPTKISFNFTQIGEVT